MIGVPCVEGMIGAILLRLAVIAEHGLLFVILRRKAIRHPLQQIKSAFFCFEISHGQGAPALMRLLSEAIS